MMRLFKFLIPFILIPSLAFGAGSVDIELNTTDHITYSDSAFDHTSAVTECSWAKLESKAIGGSDVNTLIAKGLGATAGLAYDLKYHSGPATFRMSLRNAGGTQVNFDGTTNPSTAVWYFVCSTWSDSDDTGYVYVNGVQEGTNTLAGPLNNTADVLTLGCAYASGSCGATSRYDGLLSNATVYSTRLSVVNINQIMWLPESVPGRTLMAPLWENSSPAKDLSGNGNSGTWINSTTSSNDGPPVMFGSGLPL